MFPRFLILVFNSAIDSLYLTDWGKISKDHIVSLALDYQNKFDSTLASIRNEVSDLKKDFEKLDSDLPVAKQVNSVLRERLTSLERQRWSNSQLETSDNNILESTLLKIFERLEVNADPSNVEDCHWICSKNDSKRVILKVSKRNSVTKICFSKAKLRDMDLNSIGINNPVYINESRIKCRIIKCSGGNASH